MLEYPVWLVCGFLVPVTLLPDWVRPISWVLAPTWGMNADPRRGARRRRRWADIAMCVVLGGLYTALGIVLLELRCSDRRARRRRSR